MSLLRFCSCLINFRFCSCLINFTCIILLITQGIIGATFTLVNRCSYTVWPGILANADSSKLDSTGFELAPGSTRSFQAPSRWSGRFWGRRGCTFDPNTGQGSCDTGDCGSNQIECNGAGAKPPATLAEFTIGSGPDSGNQDFYDVSLVDGYNLPMIIEADGGSGLCAPTGCLTDLNRFCPNELRVGAGQACKSACEAFGSPEYCCSGAYGSPSTCKPSVYSQMFKSACPKSYSYAYDDATSTFTCTGADYTITFCPRVSSQKSSRDNSSPPATTGITNSGPQMGYTGSTDDGSVFGSSQQPNNYPKTGDGSWLSSFLVGESSRTISSFSLYNILALILLSFLTTCFQL
ncbi:hypothetical protein LIER_40421 [Lithospermum erythrorhizon]|uniref:Uncharacterized protein n=1 Tax=Lithospermum erythrorhizon TaxID=34254 RepID=A0AAV3QUC9_LITER